MARRNQKGESVIATSILVMYVMMFVMFLHVHTENRKNFELLKEAAQNQTLLLSQIELQTKSMCVLLKSIDKRIWWSFF
jgi:hypothetical protein